MREYVLAMHAIWETWNEGKPLDFQGDFYSFTLMTPYFVPAPTGHGRPKVFVAGVNDRMTEVAGEVADGFFCHGFTTARFVRERSIPVASLLTEARPTDLAEDTLTLEFPAGADFHRRQVAEPQNIGLLRDALYEVTGRKLAVVLESREADADVAEEIDDEPAGEDLFIAALKERFDAEEVEEPDA